MSLQTSVLTGGVSNHQTTSEEVNAVATDFASQGVIGTLANTSGVAPMTGGLAVNAQGTPDATVAVSAGVAYITATPTSQNSQKFRVKNTASANVTISANASGSTKYDWLYLKLDPTALNAPNTAGDDAASFVTSRSSSATSDDGTPPTYGVNIAVITVANGFTTITNGNIRDTRTQSGMTTSNEASANTDWSNLGATPSSVTYNGNRSYDLLFTGTDLTDTVSNGMRLKTTRLVNAPTQCTSLNGTTQYYSKSSPAGMTFTDDFVVSAWVKLNAYGSQETIASRFNASSGWAFRVESSGQLTLVGTNAGGGNFSQVQSYQSIPLNKWVHVAAQLDMSAFTATTTTSYVMIDGVDVPASVSRGGTNPTALVQAGNLEIGSINGGTSPWNGKIAQVAIYNAKVTQATMRTYISQGLSGSETSLISAYSFNNSINDLNTTNANNLTANGSAVATNADSPFTQDDTGTPSGTTDYAIITKKVFSTNTTLTVQVPEGCTIPTSGGVSAVSYSSNVTPYGFPNDEGRFKLQSIYRTTASSTVTTAYTNTNNKTQLFLPVGRFKKLGYKGPVVQGTANNIAYTALSAGASSGTPLTPLLADEFYLSASVGYATQQAWDSYDNSAAAQQIYLNQASNNAGGITVGWQADNNSATVIEAVPVGI